MGQGQKPSYPVPGSQAMEGRALRACSSLREEVSLLESGACLLFHAKKKKLRISKNVKTGRKRAFFGLVVFMVCEVTGGRWVCVCHIQVHMCRDRRVDGSECVCVCVCTYV